MTELAQSRAPMHGNVIGLIAVDFVLWVIGAGMVVIALVVDVSRMHADDVTRNAAGLRIPAHAIAYFESGAHDRQRLTHQRAARRRFPASRRSRMMKRDRLYRS